MKEFSHEFWQLFERTAGASVAVHPESMVILRANEQFCQWSGFEQAEIEGVKTIRDFVLPEDFEALATPFQQWLRGDGSAPAEFEVRGISRSRTVEHCRVSACSIGSPPIFFYTIADLRPIKEKQTREAQYQTLLEHCGAALALVDSNFLIVYVNRSYEELTGYASHEIVGKKTAFDLLTEESKRFAYEWSRQRKAGDASYIPEGEMSGVHKNGDIRHIFVMSAPLPGSGHLLLSFIDITRRRQAEDRLALRLHREALLNQIISDLIDVSEFNLEDKLEEVLTKVLEGFGMLRARLFAHNEQSGRRRLVTVTSDSYEAPKGARAVPAASGVWDQLCDLESPADLAHSTEPAVKQALSGAPMPGFLYALPHDAGVLRQVLLLENTAATVLSEADINLLNAVITISGTVLQKVAVAEQHREMEEQLKRAQRLDSIGVLSSGIAHDFNNILACMVGNAELINDLLLEHDLPTDGMEDLLLAGRRGRDLTKQILTFSSRTEAVVDRVDVRTICEEALRLLRASIPLNITIKQEYPPSSSFHVQGDGTQLLQLVVNLFTNAFQSMDQHSAGLLYLSLCEVDRAEVPESLHLSEAPRFLSLHVSDTGGGIPPDVIDHVFDPFFTTRSRSGGSGMGLSVVHGIVTAHGGTITVDSVMGAGTTFRIFLPAAESPPQGHPTEPERDRQGIAKAKILVVDDETSILQVTRTILEREGCDVLALQCGLEAIRQFKVEPNRWDLVITDMIMPKASGQDVAQAIREQRNDIPVVLCSGYSAPSQLMSSDSGLFSAFLQKPFRRDDLLEMISSIM